MRERPKLPRGERKLREYCGDVAVMLRDVHNPSLLNLVDGGGVGRGGVCVTVCVWRLCECGGRRRRRRRWFMGSWTEKSLAA